MSLPYKRYVFSAGALLVLAGMLFFAVKQKTPQTPLPVTAETTVFPTLMAAQTREEFPAADNVLKDSVIAAGEYLVRQQIPNGELSYQVDFLSGERLYSPSHVRLMAGTGALFTVCRVSTDLKYCTAGDLALEHYLELLVSDPGNFKGTCFYTEGNCQLGGAALVVDTIYKRWQATGDFFLKDRSLLNTATELGYFIVSMRKPEGGFYHAFDPYFGGTVDADFYMTFASAEGLLAFMDLYEMTGNEFWLTQAHEVNKYLISQPVTEDHWHCYALSKLARLDSLTQADMDYARQIAQTIIAGEVRSLNPKNTSISTATKVEALSALSQAFYLSGENHEWLDPEIRTFITFVQARQLPENNCGWNISSEITKKFGGGIFSSCDDPTIRVDGLQNWINGVTTYLEYQSMIKK